MITLTVSNATGIVAKSIGLLGKKTPQSIFIKTRFGIHTFGMRFPIDILILDNEHTVVAMKQHFLPNRLYFWNPRYDHVVELPAGMIEKKQITVGDTITLSFHK